VREDGRVGCPAGTRSVQASVVTGPAAGFGDGHAVGVGRRDTWGWRLLMASAIPSRVTLQPGVPTSPSDLLKFHVTADSGALGPVPTAFQCADHWVRVSFFFILSSLSVFFGGGREKRRGEERGKRRGTEVQRT
jgi:hypothetical protein